MNTLRRLGLTLGFATARSPLMALAIGLLFGTYMAVADATVFHSAVPRSQQALVASTTALSRIAVYMVNAAYSELALRLVCMTLIVAGVVAIAGRAARWCYWLAIALVTFVAYPLWDLAYFAAWTPSPLAVARELALHFAASALWGWLYWRHGFLAALVGHCSAHLALQPLLGLLA